MTVLIFQVTLRIDTEEQKRVALTDCGFDRVIPHWDQCRLIGRTSIAKRVAIDLIPGETGAAPWMYPIVALPGDLHQGDLLAVPCAGAVTLGDVRPKPQAGRTARGLSVVAEQITPQHAGEAPGDHDDEQWQGRCLK